MFVKQMKLSRHFEWGSPRRLWKRQDELRKQLKEVPLYEEYRRVNNALTLYILGIAIGLVALELIAFGVHRLVAGG